MIGNWKILAHPVSDQRDIKAYVSHLNDWFLLLILKCLWRVLQTILQEDITSAAQNNKGTREQSSFSSVAPMNQYFQENIKPRLILSLLFFLPWDFSCKTSTSDVSASQSDGYWLSSEICLGAVHWGQNHRTTDNALQSTSNECCHQIFTF